MKSILTAMKNGTITVIATKDEEQYVVTIVPKQSELAPITISGTLDDVLFDLDNTDLQKSIGLATDLEKVVTDYETVVAEQKKVIEKKSADNAKTATAAATTTVKPTTGSSKVKPKKANTSKSSAGTNKTEDDEPNAFD